MNDSPKELDGIFERLDRFNTHHVLWEDVKRRRTDGSPQDRRGRRILVIASALALAAIPTAGLWLAFGQDPDPLDRTQRPLAPGSPSDVDSTAVGATGLVVAYSADDIRFCEPTIPASWEPGSPPACNRYVLAQGVNLSALSDGTTQGGVTWGLAYLEGHLDGEVLDVSRQGPPMPGDDDLELADPPCPPPAGGWSASSGDNLNTTAIDEYRATHPSRITSVAVFRPSAGVKVLTVASTDPSGTFAAMAPAYRGRLCVVLSRYSAEQVSDAHAWAEGLLADGAANDVVAVGVGTGDDGQPQVVIDAFVATTSLREALESQPAGLVTIRPWLRHVD